MTALNGVRVIDFSWVGAGSFTTRLLAEHGADVVKVESATHVDSLRLGPPFAEGIPGVNRSGYFAERNANKKSVALNLKDPRGVEIARGLIADADVVANNFRPGVMANLGLGYDELRAINPRIIYLSMSMQGDTGPESAYSGYGITIAATSGLTHVSGEPDRHPVGTGTHYPDHVPNPAHAAFALLAAIRHQRRTGRGQAIEIAQTEPTIAGLGAAVLEWTALGTEPGRLGNRHRSFAPHGVFPARGEDEWVAIAIRTDQEWRSLVAALRLDATWEALDAAERVLRRDEVEAAVSASTSLTPRSVLIAQLQSLNIAAAPVATAADLIDQDPQLRHRGHWVRLDHPEMGRSLYGTAPFRLSVTPGRLEHAAPLLGEHTVEVLASRLDLSPAQITDLADAGVLS